LHLAALTPPCSEFPTVKFLSRRESVASSSADVLADSLSLPESGIFHYFFRR
jgi:hypothetical protein